MFKNVYYQPHSRLVILVLLLVLLLFHSVIFNGCTSIMVQERKLINPDEASTLDKDSKYLKAHMLDGRVYILTNWEVVSENRTVTGNGRLLDMNRDKLSQGAFEISVDSVVIFETNVNSLSGSAMFMNFITLVSVGVTVACLANPKACFGSCPTFYADYEGDKILQAEGFSSSVAPSLEKSDIDALYRVQPSDREFELEITNEALETHMIRYADILAVKHPENGRVFVDRNGDFYQCHNIISPDRCYGTEGNCLDEISFFDGDERRSLADSVYLGTKEEIMLEFDNIPSDNYGLVISSRQSLMSTYLFYQTLAYMGDSVGSYFSILERNSGLSEQLVGGVGRILGGVEVFVLDDNGNWKYIDEVGETGPLATDTKIIPLPALVLGARLKLRLTQGYIRLDYIALASLGEAVNPIRLPPHAVYRDSLIDNEARLMLHDPDSMLVTLPGDVYRLSYFLPEDFGRYELFLESRGYYLEWIREEWLPEENQAMAAMMIFNPEAALYHLAPEYKKVEPYLEELFWSSKYGQ